MKADRILAIVPARGGSKGIPRKNMHPVLGEPLLFYTIRLREELIKKGIISEMVVSSDSKEILDYAFSLGCPIKLRPEELSGDNVPCDAVVKHLLKSLPFEYDAVLVLQPTSPLREFSDIKACVEYYRSRPMINCLISVCEMDNSVCKCFVMNEKNFLKGLVNDEMPFVNRQDLPKVYKPNGAIYLMDVKLFLETGKLFSDNAVPYIMPESRSLDIDMIDDIGHAAECLSRRNGIKY